MNKRSSYVYTFCVLLPRGKVIKQTINLIYKLSPLSLLSKLIPSRSKLLEIYLRFHPFPLDLSNQDHNGRGGLCWWCHYSCAHGN